MLEPQRELGSIWAEIKFAGREIGIEPSASFEEVSVHQTRDSLDGEMSPLHRNYEEFKADGDGKPLKVAAVISGGKLHVVVGREDLLHSELIFSRSSPLAPTPPLSIEGGAFIRIDWKSGQVEIYGESRTMKPMNLQVRPVVTGSLMRVVAEYRALLSEATE
jgi:hypothetical protein